MQQVPSLQEDIIPAFPLSRAAAVSKFSPALISRARPKPKDENSLLARTPFKEIYYSSRAILPLIICLVCIVLFILKKPLPEISFYLKVFYAPLPSSPLPSFPRLPPPLLSPPLLAS